MNTVYSKLAGRMRVRFGSHSRRFRSAGSTPQLSVAQEELLLRRVPIDLFQRMSGHPVHERHESQANAAVVSRILAQGQFPIQMDAGDRAERPILLDDTIGTFLESLAVFRSPPVAKIAPTIR